MFRNFCNIMAAGLGSTCGWFGAEAVNEQLANKFWRYNKEEDRFSEFKVSCAYWDSSPRSDRFIKKHLLEAFGAGGHIFSSNDVLKWTRGELNRQTMNLLNYSPNGNPQEQKFGSIKRLTIILESAQNFIQAIYDNHTTQPLNVHQLATGALSRNKKYHSPDTSPTYETNMFWHQEKCSVLLAMYKQEQGDYDFYTIDEVFVIVGTDVYKNKSQMTPVHLEGFILARPGEKDAFDLKGNSNIQQIQARTLRAESFINWFIGSSICIHGVK